MTWQTVANALISDVFSWPVAALVVAYGFGRWSLRVTAIQRQPKSISELFGTKK
jgi:hypothetical protein